MRTYIYPILKTTDIEDGNDEDSVFFYWSGFEAYSPDSYYSSQDLTQYGSTKLDSLPTIKMSVKPEAGYEGENSRARLLPLPVSSRGSSNPTAASEMKWKGLNFTNSYGYTQPDLKKYCIYNTNL